MPRMMIGRRVNVDRMRRRRRLQDEWKVTVWENEGLVSGDSGRVILWATRCGAVSHRQVRRLGCAVDETAWERFDGKRERRSRNEGLRKRDRVLGMDQKVRK